MTPLPNDEDAYESFDAMSESELDYSSDIILLFESNCEEIERLFWLVCDSPNSDDLCLGKNQRAWKQIITEIVLRLHNCAALGFQIFSRSEGVRRQCSSVLGRLSECQRDHNKRTADDQVTCFVQEASDYCTYHDAPHIGTAVTFLDLQHDTTKKQVTLAKEGLLHCDWSDSAIKYINESTKSIDLREIFTEYRDAIRDCIK
jgi:hypothetical protein